MTHDECLNLVAALQQEIHNIADKYGLGSLQGIEDFSAMVKKMGEDTMKDDASALNFSLISLFLMSNFHLAILEGRMLNCDRLVDDALKQRAQMSIYDFFRLPFDKRLELFSQLGSTTQNTFILRALLQRINMSFIVGNDSAPSKPSKDDDVTSFSAN